jgi:hypothetical protein
MAQSGQIVAQEAQPVHCSMCATSAGLYPWWFSREERLMIFLGQKSAQSMQPLQRSFRKMTLDIAKPTVLRIIS